MGIFFKMKSNPLKNPLDKYFESCEIIPIITYHCTGDQRNAGFRIKDSDALARAGKNVGHPLRLDVSAFMPHVLRSRVPTKWVLTERPTSYGLKGGIR
jgi:hypothetical protein